MVTEATCPASHIAVRIEWYWRESSGYPAVHRNDEEVTTAVEQDAASDESSGAVRKERRQVASMARKQSKVSLESNPNILDV